MKLLKKSYIKILLLLLFALIGLSFIFWKDGIQAVKEVSIYMIIGCSFILLCTFVKKRYD